MYVQITLIIFLFTNFEKKKSFIVIKIKNENQSHFLNIKNILVIFWENLEFTKKPNFLEF